MALVDTVWYANAGDQSTTGHYAVAKRPQNTAVVAGQIVRQFTAPTVGNERVFVCIVAGTTANVTDATWVLTRGAKTTDGTATWMECTGQAGLNGDLTNTATWAQVKAATPAVLGQVIKRSSGASYQICTTAGAMSASEPTFSDTAGVTTTDTTAVWTSLGVVGNFTGGQAPFARLASVFGASWFAAGGTIYVGDNHAESQTTQITITFSSTAAISKVICHNHSGSYPPASGDLTTGATITTSFGNSASINLAPVGWFYFYGLTFKSASGTSNPYGMVIGGSSSNIWYYFDRCSVQIASSGGTGFIQVGQGGAGTWAVIVFNNTTAKFGGTAEGFVPAFAQLTWQNTGQVLESGSSVPTNFFNTRGLNNNLNSVVLEALDLSQLTGTLYSNASFATAGTFLVKDCKLHASATPAALSNQGMTVQLVRSSS